MRFSVKNLFYMYKYLLLLILGLASFSANAQMSDRLSEHPSMGASSVGKSTREDAVAVTREMTNRLRLNEAQFMKLLPLNRIKLAGLSIINREYKDDAAIRAAKAAELEAQFEQECSRILTPTQLSQLQQKHDQPTPANAGNGLG